ncbi:GNAT family N-acetyltransferase [Sphingomonas sp. So64.6b]|uniref:GNAT family N-acetyltransferase n=1 Tax=Sphingomonas sp. So64.6b TaxID=2997354 RepID=UPI00160174E6|nr:GNAT family N-acetyltransferase [Sphingomonas sp. So64.6b]QNA83614.1 GNAT family N-acetyltransferase [Sphingomonas sp. So64.6b]
MITTERLILRPYAARDRAALREQCDDPEVMRFLLAVPDDDALDTMIDRMAGYLLDYGFTFWTVERRSDGAVIGVCRLKPGAPGTPIADEVEIGWRLSRDYWGQGYAREAAQASLDWAWANTDARTVAAITVPDNQASWRLMERLGMHRIADGDFDHPLVEDGSPLKRHILYRIERPNHG